MGGSAGPRPWACAVWWWWGGGSVGSEAWVLPRTPALLSVGQLGAEQGLRPQGAAASGVGPFPGGAAVEWGPRLLTRILGQGAQAGCTDRPPAQLEAGWRPV